jgi:hypothetical protein
MRCVRYDRRFGTWLALFALALQIALSFGHVHPGDFRHAGSALAAAAGTSSAPSAPAHHPVNDADDYCAVCATIHLAATSLLPQTLPLPVPFAARAVEHVNYTAATFFPTRRAPFQSRAPPLA